MSKAKYKAEMERLIDLWKPVLGLQDWRVDIVWKRRLKEKRFAQIKPQVEYKVATLYLSEQENRHSSLLEREDTIVHELTHCIQEPLVSSQEDAALERVTTDVARSLIRARDAALELCSSED